MALRGIKVLEMAGLAPAPFCGMILSDFGANVIRVDKPNSPDLDRLCRGKRSIVVDLKHPDGISVVKRLSNETDVIIDPYRRGVMEKLNLGPQVLMAENPRLIYARLSGFGHYGPIADRAGHDINYLSMSGILSTLGRKESTPLAPANALADFASGGLLCAMGIGFALFERSKSGKGQLIDNNMTEGTAYVCSWMFTARNLHVWGNPRGENWFDSGVHFYDTYETSDKKHMAVGAVEPQFYESFIALLGLDVNEVTQFGEFYEKKKLVAQKFKEKSQAEWCKIFEGTDSCVTPVLTLDEAPTHPHNVVRGSFFTNPYTGQPEPQPHPRLSRSPHVDPTRPPPSFGEHTSEVLRETGFSESQIEKLVTSGAVQSESIMKAKL